MWPFKNKNSVKSLYVANPWHNPEKQLQKKYVTVYQVNVELRDGSCTHYTFESFDKYKEFEDLIVYYIKIDAKLLILRDKNGTDILHLDSTDYIHKVFMQKYICEERDLGYTKQLVNFKQLGENNLNIDN